LWRYKLNEVYDRIEKEKRYNKVVEEIRREQLIYKTREV